MADQITQAEMVELLEAQATASTASKNVEVLKGKLAARFDAGATQESGSLKLEVSHPPYNTPAYKGALETVLTAIKALKAVYVNGNGKPHQLNDKLQSIRDTAVEAAIPKNEDGTGKTTTKVDVKPNVASAVKAVV